MIYEVFSPIVTVVFVFFLSLKSLSAGHACCTVESILTTQAAQVCSFVQASGMGGSGHLITYTVGGKLPHQGLCKPLFTCYTM